MVTHLPGITRIGYVETKYLPTNIMYKSQAGIPVAIMTNVKPIKFFGMPQIEADMQFVNFGTIEEISIRFDSLDDIPLNRDIAFVVQDANNENFIIGSKEEHAVIHRQYDSSDTDGKATYTYKINHKSRKALIKVTHIWDNSPIC